MNKNSKILVIVEGEKTEKQLMHRMCKEYGIDILDNQIYCYTTNIYDLYDRIFKDSLDEIEDLDFLLALKEKGINEENKDILTSNNYSDVLLMFDYEPQDHQFSIDKIEFMLEYFSESTENGKLYINYPSVESFKHIKSFPDYEYVDNLCQWSKLANTKRL